MTSHSECWGKEKVWLRIQPPGLRTMPLTLEELQRPCCQRDQEWVWDKTGCTGVYQPFPLHSAWARSDGKLMGASRTHLKGSTEKKVPMGLQEIWAQLIKPSVFYLNFPLKHTHLQIIPDSGLFGAGLWESVYAGSSESSLQVLWCSGVSLHPQHLCWVGALPDIHTAAWETVPSLVSLLVAHGTGKALWLLGVSTLWAALCFVLCSLSFQDSVSQGQPLPTGEPFQDSTFSDRQHQGLGWPHHKWWGHKGKFLD